MPDRAFVNQFSSPWWIVTESADIRIGVVIPTYRHAARLPGIVALLRSLSLPVLIVDDGNQGELAAQVSALKDPAACVAVLRRDVNGGKGAAVKDGLRAARALGWTHAFQVDADGQHDLGAASTMVSHALSNPVAVVCGVPVYDRSIPTARRIGREITHFWVRIETLSNEILDSMCG